MHQHTELDALIKAAFDCVQLDDQRLCRLRSQIAQVQRITSCTPRQKWTMRTVRITAAAAVLGAAIAIGYAAHAWKSHTGQVTAPEALVPVAGPDLAALEFYADWCVRSQVVNPRCAKLRDEFGEQDLVFVGFDLTDAISTKQSEMLAESLGLLEVWRSSYRNTGELLLVDRKSGRVLHRLTLDDDFDAMREAVRDVLAGSL